MLVSNIKKTITLEDLAAVFELLLLLLLLLYQCA